MTIDKICKDISKQTGEDVETVKSIVMHQFKFIAEVMKDEEDTHDILIHNLFKFQLKNRFKQNKTLKYKAK